jgi:hypothetical protein
MAVDDLWLRDRYILFTIDALVKQAAPDHAVDAQDVADAAGVDREVADSAVQRLADEGYIDWRALPTEGRLTAWQVLRVTERGLEELRSGA